MTLREKFSQWLEEEPFDVILLTLTIVAFILIGILTLSVIMLATVIGGAQ
ncbi:hypothetical protein GCM10009604_04080 [Corynebacterium aurimucosum]|nr:MULTISPECIES: hypothetical protein [Corynebacterium]QQU96655.1 hypothetical protein I6I66_06195 [Corynebacterium aurimucosum]UTA70493.1 hypothetical protein J3S22_06670 [Corynebacterium aurimucosum]WJY71033.1 hypothetical protein CAURIM_09675 [Corynebacterium aurimucosum]